MQTRESALVAVGGGVEGDYKGVKHPRRGVTVLAREAWEAALAELGAEAAPSRSRGPRGAPTCWSRALPCRARWAASCASVRSCSR